MGLKFYNVHLDLMEDPLIIIAKIEAGGRQKNGRFTVLRRIIAVTEANLNILDLFHSLF